MYILYWMRYANSNIFASKQSEIGKVDENNLGGTGVWGFLYTFHTPFRAFLIFIIIRFQSALYMTTAKPFMFL